MPSTGSGSDICNVNLLPDLLPAFLSRQRWFGGKGRTIARCEIEDVAELPAAIERTAVVITNVSYADGQLERYALVISQGHDALSPPRGDRLEIGGYGIVEVGTDPAAVRALLRGFAHDDTVTTRRGGRLRYADVGKLAASVLQHADVPITALRGEQSNTSLRIGADLVLKLFRRLQPGENPELEVGRFLTSRTTFRAMSALEGSLTYEPPTSSPATLGVLQAWIENDGDGWAYFLSALRRHRRTGSVPADLPAAIARLGAITSELHAALESDASLESFRPEAVDATDVEHWSALLRTRLARSADLVHSHVATWPDETRRLGLLLLANGRFTGAVDVVPPSRATFCKIRIHGDYHLGQTLKTSSAFAIIDFEGEPLTPIAHRRQKFCALKDVAGMLRSFDYAIETGFTSSPTERDSTSVADALPAEVAPRRWFLDGYLESATALRTTAVPGDRTETENWLSFFELDKALYELEYEIHNRPEWVHIPLRGIRGLLGT
jgi:maltose alpha-D-glucosyltransferase/alpha-amylase